MASDMVERVARAIWDRVNRNMTWDDAISVIEGWPVGAVATTRLDARAAIEAMWEPSTLMVVEAEVWLADDTVDPILKANTARGVWSAMIDAALSD